VLAAAVARRLDERARPTRSSPAPAPCWAGLPVTAASREVALTDRHLRRRFHDAVGYGPKTLQRVLRLRRFLALAEAGATADLARAAAEAGYSDQPHLTRECATSRACLRRRCWRRAPRRGSPAALSRRARGTARPARHELLGDAQRLADLDVLHVVVLVAGGRGRRQGGQAGAALEERALDVPADDALGRQDGAPPHERAAGGDQRASATACPRLR
jgi:AraC-like DNA-binding protein